MKITEDYVSFETAKLLIEKGFDDSVSAYYHIWDNGSHVCTALEFTHSEAPHLYIPAPTLQIVMKWLEIKKHIAIIPVLSSILDNEKFLWDVKIVIAETSEKYSQGWVYENREQACEAAIKYVLENLI